MNNFFRALIAGYGAKKLGGGCFGTVIVFIIIWVALGQCSWTKHEDARHEPIRPANVVNAKFVDSDISKFFDANDDPASIILIEDSTEPILERVY